MTADLQTTLQNIWNGI